MARKKVSVAGIARASKAQEKKVLDARAKASPVTKDSFQNFISNVGIGTNNQSSGSTYGFNPITNERSLLEWMYRGSWIAQKSVDCAAEDMTREGIELHSTLKPDAIEKIQTAIQMTGVWPKLNEAKKMSRLYGGAIAVILVDGQDMATPLNVDTVGRGAFKGLAVFDRWMVNPSLNDLVTELGPELGNPKFYDVVAQAPGIRQQRIHHSRCFRLLGVKQPYWQALNLNLWGCSVFEPLYDRLVAFDSSTQGAAQLVYKAYLRTYKIDGLRDIIAAGGDAYAGLIKQVNTMRMFQSNEGVNLIDMKDEFETVAYSFAGLSDVLIQFAQQLSGATGIPLTRLFGQSPAGLNATGESDMRNYYDNVSNCQELEFRLPMNTTIQVAARSEGITLPPGFSYDFRPLWQASAKEKSEIAEATTRSVTSVYQEGIISAAIALKELRSTSKETGLWTNITDEDIDSADQDPPDPSEMQGGAGGEEPGEEPAEGEAKEKTEE